MSTLTVYPASDDDIYATSTVFSTAHDATTGTLRGGSASYAFATKVGSDYTVDRAFGVYDTSALGASASISATTLTVKGTFKQNIGSDACSYNVYDSTCSNPIVAGDFDLCGTTAYATAIDFASWSGSANNVWTFNATGRGAIDKTGVTKVSIREAAFDVANTAPAGNRAIGWASVESANDPQMDITYSTASGPTNLKTLDTIVKASIKTVDAVAIASLKTWDTIA